MHKPEKNCFIKKCSCAVSFLLSNKSFYATEYFNFVFTMLAVFYKNFQSRQDKNNGQKES
jgi:hypothetical protein